MEVKEKYIIREDNCQCKCKCDFNSCRFKQYHFARLVEADNCKSPPKNLSSSWTNVNSKYWDDTVSGAMSTFTKEFEKDFTLTENLFKTECSSFVKNYNGPNSEKYMEVVMKTKSEEKCEIILTRLRNQYKVLTRFLFDNSNYQALKEVTTKKDYIIEELEKINKNAIAS